MDYEWDAVLTIHYFNSFERERERDKNTDTDWQTDRQRNQNLQNAIFKTCWKIYILDLLRINYFHHKSYENGKKTIVCLKSFDLYIEHNVRYIQLWIFVSNYKISIYFILSIQCWVSKVSQKQCPFCSETEKGHFERVSRVGPSLRVLFKSWELIRISWWRTEYCIHQHRIFTEESLFLESVYLNTTFSVSSGWFLLRRACHIEAFVQQIKKNAISFTLQQFLRLAHVTRRICSKSTPKRNMLSLEKENLRMLRLRLRLHLHLNLRPLVKVGQELKVNIRFSDCLLSVIYPLTVFLFIFSSSLDPLVQIKPNFVSYIFGEGDSSLFTPFIKGSEYHKTDIYWQLF